MAGALASLARDADWAAALGRAAQQRQRKEYSIEAMTAGYAALLDAVGR
jgi:glycosyltransferase involved in cell wall biosynthesis